MKRVKWGIIGAGNMANNFASCLLKAKNAELYCIAGKTKEKLKKFQEKFKLDNENLYFEYEELLKNPNVEAVYIALTNNLHHEWINKSAIYKKHIMVEKPVCTDVNELKKSLTIIKENRVFFMEAMMYRHHPQIKILIDLLNSNKIGKVKKIEAYFGFDIGRKILGFELKKLDKNSRLLNPHLGGGAILDLGCYPLSASLLVAGIAEKKTLLIPNNINATGKIGKTGVDEIAYAEISFPNGIISQIGVAIRKKMKNFLKVIGENGYVNVPNPWTPNSKFSLEMKENDQFKIINQFSDKPLYTHEIEDASSFITNKNLEAVFPGMSWTDSLENLRFLELWRQLLVKEK